MLQPERDLGELRDALTAWLRTRVPGARDLAIAELTRPKAGFSNDTTHWEVNEPQRSVAEKSRRLLANGTLDTQALRDDLSGHVLRSLAGK